MLSSTKSGGAATCAVRLCEALRENHNDITVNLLTREDEQDGWIHSLGKVGQMKSKAAFWAEALNFEFFRKKEKKRFAFSMGKFGVDISKHPLVKEADLIHIHWINHGFLSINSIQQLIKTGKQIIFSLHDMWTFTGGCHYAADCVHYEKECGNCFWLNKPGDKDLSHKIWTKKSQVYNTKSNIRFVTSSKWLRNCAPNSSLLNKQSVIDLVTPLNTNVFQPLEKPSLRKEFNISSDKKTILFLAMNAKDERKGFIYLLNSLKKLSETNSNYEIIVVGKSSEDLLAQVSLKSHLLGFVSSKERIIEAYNAADIFVIPSLEDNLPNTIMESLACGTPCVGFDAGGIPEMIDHQINGYIAKFKDVEDLAAGIRWVLEHPNLEGLKANARKKALDTYAAPVVAKQYIQLYKDTLSESFSE